MTAPDHNRFTAGERPLAIDLFCGLGGWTEGLLAEGWRVRGYDIEAHEYGDEKYPAELVLADVLALNGADLADADLIVASPPCTEFSYMAMPWGRAKQIARALRGEDDLTERAADLRLILTALALSEAEGRRLREANRLAAQMVGNMRFNIGQRPGLGVQPDRILPALERIETTLDRAALTNKTGSQDHV